MTILGTARSRQESRRVRTTDGTPTTMAACIRATLGSGVIAAFDV